MTDQPAQTPVPRDHPLMLAWEQYHESAACHNQQHWIGHNDFVDGALWQAFCEGWFAAGGDRP